MTKSNHNLQSCDFKSGWSLRSQKKKKKKPVWPNTPANHNPNCISVPQGTSQNLRSGWGGKRAQEWECSLKRLATWFWYAPPRATGTQSDFQKKKKVVIFLSWYSSSIKVMSVSSTFYINETYSICLLLEIRDLRDENLYLKPRKILQAGHLLLRCI